MTILYTTRELLDLFPKLPRGALWFLEPAVRRLGNSRLYNLEELERAEWMEKQFMAGATMRGMKALYVKIWPGRPGPGCVKELWG